MSNINQINCKQFKSGEFIPKSWNKYIVYAKYTVDGELVENTWSVHAKSVFEADKWANIMIESVYGTLDSGVKKKIEKVK